jgi:putative flippase GtrA
LAGRRRFLFEPGHDPLDGRNGDEDVAAPAFAALISLTTNLVVMMALVTGAGLSPIVSNLIAVAVAGLVNFWAGDRLVFPPRHGLQSHQ